MTKEVRRMGKKKEREEECTPQRTEHVYKEKKKNRERDAFWLQMRGEAAVIDERSRTCQTSWVQVDCFHKPICTHALSHKHTHTHTHTQTCP